MTRVVQRTGYTDTWTDVRRANASFIGQEGAIGGLHDLKRGVLVEAQPFVTATANGARDRATGGFDRESSIPTPASTSGSASPATRSTPP